MKTSITFLLLSVLLGYAQPTFSNDNKYAEAMAKNIRAVYTAQTIAELQGAVNALERIGSTEKTKWEPYYYAAFGNIMMATHEQDGNKKDTYLDQALATIKKAKAVNENDSEIVALEGFVHMIRVTVDPASRGQQYSGLAMQTFGKAISLNPENPRALALMAQMQFGTAQFLGSSTAEACATSEAAFQKFATFKSDNPFAPQWGKEMVKELKEKCKG
jgi:tetratricopeptide (TPR) repeat protein